MDEIFGFRIDCLIVFQKMYELSPTASIKLYKTMIYIHVNEKNQGPTIAFKFRSKEGYVWIDASCRVYKSWNDFKNNNKLPECKIAYPKDGVIDIGNDEKVQVEFGESPACSTAAQVVKGTDITATVIGVGTTVLGIVGLFTPVTAPLAIAGFIAGGTTGLYGAARSTHQLVDRAIHEESISLADSEARLHWLNIATAPLCIAGGIATMATRSAAASGQVLSKTARVIVNCTIVSSFSMSTINIVNNLASLVDKAIKDELTPLDVASFAISLAFWTNSAVNLQTAEGIIKTTQREVIKGYQKNLDAKSAKQFKSMAGNTIDENKPRDPTNPNRRNMYDNAKVIRSMKQISNSEEFFRLSREAGKDITKTNRDYVRANPGAKPVRLRLGLDEFNRMSISNELKLTPGKYFDLPKDQTKAILGATINYVNTGDKNTFLNTVKGFKGVKFELQREQALNNFSQKLGTSNLKNFACGNKKPFKNMTPYESDRLAMISGTLDQFSDQQQQVAFEFAKRMSPETVSDFAAYVEYSLAVQRDQARVIDVSNKPGNIRAVDFKRQEAVKTYIDANNNFKDSGFNELKATYQRDAAEAARLNSQMDPGFKSVQSTAYHIRKHGKDAVEYMNTIRHVIENAQQGGMTHTQEGTSHIISYVLTEPGSPTCTQVLVIVDEQNQQFVMTMYERAV